MYRIYILHLSLNHCVHMIIILLDKSQMLL